MRLWLPTVSVNAGQFPASDTSSGTSRDTTEGVEVEPSQGDAARKLAYVRLFLQCRPSPVHRAPRNGGQPTGNPATVTRSRPGRRRQCWWLWRSCRSSRRARIATPSWSSARRYSSDDASTPARSPVSSRGRLASARSSHSETSDRTGRPARPGPRRGRSRGSQCRSTHPPVVIDDCAAQPLVLDRRSKVVASPQLAQDLQCSLFEV